MQIEGLEDMWLIDFGCSHHMTENPKWFFSLTLVTTKEYITFRDNNKGKIISEGAIKVSDNFTLKRVALVRPLGHNPLSVSQLLDEGFEVCFKPDSSRILDSQGELVCMIIPEGQIFCADFSTSFGPTRCLIASSFYELWKWHRRIGHLSFDLLSYLILWILSEVFLSSNLRRIWFVLCVVMGKWLLLLTHL